jgi:hypothetical protein
LLLVATFAFVSFSRENHRSGFRDFCNTIGPKPTSRHVRYSVVIGVKADIEPALLFRQQREAAA